MSTKPTINTDQTINARIGASRYRVDLRGCCPDYIADQFGTAERYAAFDAFAQEEVKAGVAFAPGTARSVRVRGQVYRVTAHADGLTVEHKGADRHNNPWIGC